MDLTRRSVIATFLLTPVAISDAPSTASQVVELHIATDGDELAFKPKHLSCPTGADVRLFLHHTGEIINDAHDWVLLKPGAKKTFLHDADQEPDETAIVPTGDEYMVLEQIPIDFTHSPHA